MKNYIMSLSFAIEGEYIIFFGKKVNAQNDHDIYFRGH